MDPEDIRMNHKDIRKSKIYVDLLAKNEEQGVLLNQYIDDASIGISHIDTINELKNLLCDNSEHEAISNNLDSFFFKNSLKPEERSLIISWGMGDKFNQIFPQDEEYYDNVFKKHKQNLILVFERGSWDDTNNYNNIFKGSKNEILAKHIDIINRIRNIIVSAFSLTSIDNIVIKKVPGTSSSITFDWNKDNNKNKLIWITKYFNVPTLILNYMDVIRKTSYRDLVCNDYGPKQCSNRFDKISFLNNNFSNMMYSRFGKLTNTNLTKLKDKIHDEIKGKRDPYSGRIYKNTNSTIKINYAPNIWSSFNGSIGTWVKPTTKINEPNHVATENASTIMAPSVVSSSVLNTFQSRPVSPISVTGINGGKRYKKTRKLSKMRKSSKSRKYHK